VTAPPVDEPGKLRFPLGFEAGEPKRQNAFWTATSQEFLLTWYERLTYISGCLRHSSASEASNNGFVVS